MGFLTHSVNSSNTTSNQTGTTSGTTKQDLTGEQSGALSGVSSLIQSLLNNPTKNLQPLQTEAVNKVNAGYASTLPSLREAMLSSGGDASGKFGSAVATANQARLGKIADTNTDFAQKALDQQQLGASLAMQLLSHIFSQSNTGTSTSSGTGTSKGSSTGMGTSFSFGF